MTSTNQQTNQRTNKPAVATNQPTNKPINQLTSLTNLIILFLAINCLLTATAYAADFAGSLKSVSITDSAGANQPPTAVINYTQNGDAYTFDASGSSDPDGSIVEYRWDFGDGGAAVGSTATHTFVSSGTFPVTLAVVDSRGAVVLNQVALERVSSVLLELESSEGGANAGKMYDTRRQIWVGSGADTAQFVPGKTGNCAQVSSADNYLLLPASDVFSGLTKFTVSFDIKYDSISADGNDSALYYVDSTNGNVLVFRTKNWDLGPYVWFRNGWKGKDVTMSFGNATANDPIVGKWYTYQINVDFQANKITIKKNGVEIGVVEDLNITQWQAIGGFVDIAHHERGSANSFCLDQYQIFNW